VAPQNTSKAGLWAARIFAILVAIAFAPGAFMKLSRHPMVLEGMSKMGIPDWGPVALGAVELACLVVYLIPRTTLLGTLLLTGYLGGATLANIIARTDVIHVFAVGLLVWAGAWFRVPEFRALIPWRKQAAGNARGTGAGVQ
jgi:hypothetical protein